MFANTKKKKYVIYKHMYVAIIHYFVTSRNLHRIKYNYVLPNINVIKKTSYQKLMIRLSPRLLMKMIFSLCSPEFALKLWCLFYVYSKTLTDWRYVSN